MLNTLVDFANEYMGSQGGVFVPTDADNSITGSPFPR